jgi:hypothetical protein
MNTQPLFNYLNQEFGVSPLESDMQEIINIVNEMTIQEQLNDLSERLNRIEEQLGTNHNSVADAIRPKPIEPDPYQVDWNIAPEGTVAHAYDADGQGHWYTVTCGQFGFSIKYYTSEFALPSGLDWKQSLRVNPKLK